MNVVAKAAQQAISLLTALKADFKIILPTGEQYGNLEIASPKPEPRYRRYPHGTLVNVYRPFLDEMVVGDTRVIPAPEGIEVKHLRGAVAGHASKFWGNGSAKTCITGNTVEILRVL